jgi:hypothetical protein
LEKSGIDGKIILNGSSRSKMRVWTALIWLRMGTGSGLL